MNPEQIMNTLQTMGPVFWVAATAVAVGTVMLVLALGSVLRNQRWSRKGPAFSLPGFPSRKGRTVPNPVRTTADGYEAVSFTGPAQTTSETPGSPEFGQLAHRLASAADTLEEMRRELMGNHAPLGHSGLKPEENGVEYLVRTTVG